METSALPAAGLTVDDLPADQWWPRHELFDGSLHVTPMADLRHQQVVADLTAALRRLAPRDLVVLPGANIVRDDGNLLIPDVAVVARDAVERATLAASPADVAMVAEVVSPSTRLVDRTAKLERYAEWGVPTYWIVDPRAAQISRHGEVPVPTWAAGLRDAEIFE